MRGKGRPQKHGMSETKVHAMWRGIKSRCYNINHNKYKYYGERGICMQEDWVSNFMLFYKYVTSLDDYDSENIGRKGLSLDRIKNNEGYKEGNLRWTTQTMQNRNRRISKRNKTGYIGVTKEGNRYRAVITVNKKKVCLGSRGTAKEASDLRRNYIIKHKLEGFVMPL